MGKEGMTEEEYWYWLTNIEGIGRITIERMLEGDRSPKELFDAGECAVKRYLKSSQYDAFIYSRNRERIQREYDALEARGIHFLSCCHKNYPDKFRNLPDSPPGIYLKGNLPDQKQPAIAIVGSRMPTPYGREMAEWFGRELGKSGVAVVSGLARGVDSLAHRGALAGKGMTVGVLGCGINICYPPEHIELYHQMEREGGIVTEQRLGTEPNPGLFPLRNRLISGLSDGILIVEAREKSGSLITADLGLDQGKEIYALPGRCTDRSSDGTNCLIQMGAKLVLRPGDILDDFQIFKADTGNNFEKNDKMLDKNSKAVYHCLSLEPKYMDLIVQEVQLPVQEVLSILFVLELNGFIKQVIKNYYSICL